MINYKTLRKSMLVPGLALLLVSWLAGCQPESDTAPVGGDESSSQSAQPAQNDTQTDPDEPVSSQESEPDPAAIEAAWQSSPHAEAYVVDTAGQNNSCARCHAPINWMPSMDELPESCFACKFELEAPPPYIQESEWANIPCNVCHEVDRDENIQPEIAWLEIAPLGEYIAVGSPTELCLKCHAPTDTPGHGDIQLGGDHADYECTECHSAHDTTASCDAEGCHSDVIEPATPIPGHDADHQTVSCVACHDGSGMEVGPDEEQSLWTTFTSDPAGTGLDSYAFTSHMIVLEARCDRCHFADNPWALSADVTGP